MTADEATAHWTQVLIYLTIIFLVLGVVGGYIVTTVRRRMLGGPPKSQYDPLHDLLSTDKGPLTEEEQRLLRRKMAEKLVGGCPPEDKE